MNEQMNKTKILELVQSERVSLERILDSLSPEQMMQPGLQGGWSVKDFLAHITDWEQRMIRWIEESLRGDVPQRPEPGMTWDDLDRLNEQVYQANKGKPLNQVLAEFHGSYHQALRAVQVLSQDQLTNPYAFEWRDGAPLWQMVAANTWLHYQEHRDTIENWLSNQG